MPSLENINLLETDESMGIICFNAHSAIQFCTLFFNPNIGKKEEEEDTQTPSEQNKNWYWMEGKEKSSSMCLMIFSYTPGPEHSANKC